MDSTPSDGVAAFGPHRVYRALLGLTALVVLLQSLWAGLFLHEGRTYERAWVEVHARGADVAILLAAAATVYAFVTLRERRDLWVGSGVLTVVLVLEAYLGGLIGRAGDLTAVHLPLAMALMGLVVALPLRAHQRA